MKIETDPAASKSILIVEDEGVMRATLKSVLSRRNHLVVEANNGAEAFNLFASRPFDLVVTDSVMPFLTGEELALRIRRLVPHQPILMITGSRSAAKTKAPVNAILQKPFDEVALDKEISRLLTQRQ